MSFYSKTVQESDWVMDSVTGEYTVQIPQSEHGEEAPVVVSVFERSLTEGYKFVVGQTDVNTSGDCTITYNKAIDARIIIRGD